MRIALAIEYLGAKYHGWQRQRGLMTVQDMVERALDKVAGIEGIDIAKDAATKISCAGRTDVGVHATKQIVHFDTDINRSFSAWIHGTNYYLPRDIKIYWAAPVAENFHARFSAQSRAYRYFIYNNNVNSPILNDRAFFYFKKVDVDKMKLASKCLIGEHDFSSFRSSSCQSRTPMRNIKRININRIDKIIIVDIVANAFLHRMVRNIVGSLLLVGSESQPVTWMRELLETKDKRMCGPAAAACGLYLYDVCYPTEFNIPTECFCSSVLNIL